MDWHLARSSEVKCSLVQFSVQRSAGAGLPDQPAHHCEQAPLVPHQGELHQVSCRHQQGSPISPRFEMGDFWKLLSVNSDLGGLEFVSSMEARDYPFYALQVIAVNLSLGWENLFHLCYILDELCHRYLVSYIVPT